MASYFDEHRIDERQDDAHLVIARHLVMGGWTAEMGLTFDRLFGGQSRAAHPDAIKELETMLAEDLPDENGQCLICLDKWANADEREKVIRMPCRHLFHSKCILEWLKKANSCPCCRHELPSHDPIYEEWKRQEKRKEARKADLDELHNSMFS